MAAAVTLVVAGLAFADAMVYQQRVTRPIGEGQVFLADAHNAAAIVQSEGNLDRAVRLARNALEVEAVSVVDGEGAYVASTSPNLEGGVVEEPLLLYALSQGRFAALAAPIPIPIKIDGVEEWAAGDVLYKVIEPLDDGGAVVLHYDISGLFQRRARPQGIDPVTLQRGGLGLFLLLVGVALLLARSILRRQLQEAVARARARAARARELESHNRELEAAREAAERALALAEETNRIRSEFVLMINHELRTPLTTVVTGAEVLLDAPELGEAERRRFLQEIIKDGGRLRDLVSQMLAVARIENRGLDFALQGVEVADLLDRLREVSGRFTAAGRGGDPPAVRTDPDTLIHLLASLIDNAFTHGAGRVEVRVSQELPFAPMLEVGTRPRQAVFFVVDDDGPGIDQEFLPRAFEKFEKQSRSSGTGLGLYLARMMVEALEGSICVRTGPAGTSLAVAVAVAAVREPVGV